MRVPNRLSGSLPVSIAVHLGVLLLVLVIPLTAQIALPIPASAMDAYIRATPAPPPPPAPPVRAPATRAPEAARVPLEAPRAIVPEREVAPLRPTMEGGLEVGPPGAIGIPTKDVGGLPPPPPSPPPPPKPQGPVRVGELVQPPQKVVDVRPVYPDIARIAHVQGTVVLEAVLDRSGRVSQVRVVSSKPLLDQAAIDAVRQWRYTPTTLHGLPIEVLMTITVTFTLQG
jgi:protein TonB